MHMNNDTYLAHFINNSCEPNCILKEVDSKIWLITYAPVDKNTEFTIKYDWDWVDGVPPTICTCKSNVCYGIIERNDDNYNNFIRKNPDYISKGRENSDRRCIPGGICFCPMMISFGKKIKIVLVQPSLK
uniref:SET domain-containing protein n=1 Tax=Panagrolaimus superbus TaxID=310955 RepID=A0A914YL29_9BILA